jgi:hypothetical protein
VKKPSFYSFLALIILLSVAVTSGCSAAIAPAALPLVTAVPASSSVIAAPVTATNSGSPDLVVTRVWLEGVMINYTIKNAGTADSPQTYSYIYVNDLMPAQGGTSLVDILKPGQEKTFTFSNYQWPFARDLGTPPQVHVDPRGYIDLPTDAKKVRVTANGDNQVEEANKANNSRTTIIGLLWNYDLLREANLATWRNGDGDIPGIGSETDAHGAHMQVPNMDMEVTPQLEMMPQQVPQGWMQGIWGYFYGDQDSGARKVTAITLPPKLHFVARVGLAPYASGTDGVTFKFGLKDINDNVTWLSSKKISSPGSFENWDINLGDYEGQKYYFVLRVDAGASPANDFAVWNQAKLMQVND